MIRRILPKGAVIYELDKNTNRAWVECPKKLEQRLIREIFQNQAFVNVPFSISQVEQNFRQVFEDYELTPYGKWRNGLLPNTFVIPKWKDPLAKSRVISSYFRHPLRCVYKTASAVLTWLFLSTKGRIKHWNLFRLDELPDALRSAEKRVATAFGSESGAV